MHQPIHPFVHSAYPIREVLRSPMHLSTQINSLAAARLFYGDNLGCEERRATKTSIHFDFFGNQLTLHETTGFAGGLSKPQELPVRSFGARVPRTWIEETKAIQDAENGPEARTHLRDPSGTRLTFIENKEPGVTPHPMHLSVNCRNIDVTRSFYMDLLGCAEMEDEALPGATAIDFFGHSLFLNETPAFNAVHMHASVAAEDVPVPHFGAAIDVDRFHDIGRRLDYDRHAVILQPHKRFVGLPHEQWVLFVLDPSGNAVEMKSFTRAPIGEWI